MDIKSPSTVAEGHRGGASIVFATWWEHQEVPLPGMPPYRRAAEGTGPGPSASMPLERLCHNKDPPSPEQPGKGTGQALRQLAGSGQVESNTQALTLARSPGAGTAHGTKLSAVMPPVAPADQVPGEAGPQVLRALGRVGERGGLSCLPRGRIHGYREQVRVGTQGDGTHLRLRTACLHVLNPFVGETPCQCTQVLERCQAGAG